MATISQQLHCCFNNKSMLLCVFVLWTFLAANCIFFPVAKIDSISFGSHPNRNSTKDKSDGDLISSQTVPSLATINRTRIQAFKNRIDWLNFTTVGLVNSSSKFKSVASLGRRRGMMRKQIGGHLCKVHLILDNSFVEQYGNNKARAIKAAVSLFDSSSKILLNETFVTDEGFAYRNYGNILSNITFDNNRLFNNSESEWNIKDLENRLLKQLHSHYNSTNGCLVYLLTNKNIIDKRGNAYNGFTYDGSICHFDSNVGAVSTYWCTAANDSHCIRIMAHEFAHSWGARHDTLVSSSIGGDFLMSDRLYRHGPNNLKLSKQSNSKIASVIHEIDHNCLVKSDESHCGNSFVDGNGNEECDSGGASACCTDECKFQPDAMCSPFNAESCSGLCKLIEKPKPEINEILSDFYQFVKDNFGIIVIAAVMLILAVVYTVLTISYLKNIYIGQNRKLPKCANSNCV